MDKKTINITGTFEDYVKYKNSKKLKPNQIQGIVILSFCLIGVLIIIALLQDLTYVAPSSSIVQQWVQATNRMFEGGWSDVAKYLMILFAPIIMISWLIHGVQLRILA